MKTWPTKDPDDVADYVIDWYGTAEEPGPLLSDTDTISASAWTFPAGLTKDSDSFTTQHSLVWISGGTAGETYVVTNHITTAGGREFDQSVKIKVKDK